MKTVLPPILQAVLVSAALMAPSLSQAHHSFAMYDLSLHKTFTGVLTRFIVGANHSQFIFDVVDDKGVPVKGADGKTLTWGVETGAASAIAKQGITPDSFTIGTIFTVTLRPLRDGRNFGTLLDSGIILCGVKMPAGGCTKATGKVYMERVNYAAPAPTNTPPVN
jgi:hypothetical protein